MPTDACQAKVSNSLKQFFGAHTPGISFSSSVRARHFGISAVFRPNRPSEIPDDDPIVKTPLLPYSTGSNAMGSVSGLIVLAAKTAVAANSSGKKTFGPRHFSKQLDMKGRKES
jgi:hypothetical protein